MFAHSRSVRPGFIIAWSGAIADIPGGWALCDGNNGTPNLQDKFVIGAGNTYNPDASGGSTSHSHDYLGGGHTHTHDIGSGFASGGAYNSVSDSTAVSGTTDSETTLPPYYALAYIMKL